MKTHTQQVRLSTRRGTIYLLVLFSSLIVAAISLSSLQLMRLQGRVVSSSADFSAAQSCARAAIEIGMLKIRNDPYWRTRLGNGNWITSQPIGAGTFSLSAADPIDNDIRNGDNHPVVLTGTGMKGEARFQISMRMEVGPRVGSCLEVAMVSGDDIRIDGNTLTCDQSVSANDIVVATGGSTINADVEAFGGISGSTYAQAVQSGAAKRNMPDRQQVLDYYIAQGTSIPYSVLPKWANTNLIQNSSFETNTANWYPMTSCTLQQSSSRSKVGSSSLHVVSRSTSADVAAQDIPVQQVKSGHTYHLSAHVSHTSAGTAMGILILESTGEGVQTFTTPSFSSGSPNFGQYPWIDLNGNITPTWTGTLTRARIAIWISTKDSYYMDKVSLIDVTYPVNQYVMDSQLISPTVNPYGATNTKGIYVFNCAGKDVVIGNSRIVGTLVFIDPGGDSAIQGSVCWEAAVYNYPALLTNNELSIRTATTGLSEVNCGVNLNPSGTPYPFDGGTANQTTDDSYPSKITGIIYSADKLNLSGSPAIKGVVIADDDVRVGATSVVLNYGNIYLNDPPPGFSGGTITMKVVPGTWQRTVD